MDGVERKSGFILNIGSWYHNGTNGGEENSLARDGEFLAHNALGGESHWGLFGVQNECFLPCWIHPGRRTAWIGLRIRDVFLVAAGKFRLTIHGPRCTLPTETFGDFLRKLLEWKVMVLI